jgi:hypothetical protein
MKSGYISGVDLILEGIYEKCHLSINSYQFLKSALKSPSITIPNITTENSRRFLLIPINDEVDIPEKASPLADKLEIHNLILGKIITLYNKLIITISVR